MSFLGRKRGSESKTNSTSGRNSSYISKHESSGVERISKKMTEDLRKNIKSLRIYPVLSPKWCRMVDTVKKIAQIAEMESKLPKKDKAESLWDSEEVALRYILEDEQLNTCLVMMKETKIFQHQVLEHKTRLKDEDDRLLKALEQNLGFILNKIFSYREAMQMANLPLLVEYSGIILQKTMLYPQLCESKDMAQAQEILVLHYLRKMLNFMAEDAYPSRRIMMLVQRWKTVERVVMFVNLNHKKMQVADVITACEALALIFDTDEYTANKANYVASDLRQELASMEGNVIAQVLKSSTNAAALKRRIRPLMDESMRFKLSRGK